jgi:dihydrofolate synthase/folylpolyglutamate synthase
VTGATGAALEVIRRRARRVDAPLTVVPAPPLLGWDRDGIEVELPRLGRTAVGLRGRHQAVNAAVADALLDALDAAGIASVGDEARRAGSAGARWPGRLELLEVGGRELLLDGAHNPAGASALAAALDDLRPFLVGGRDRVPPPATLVVASMADKDVDGVIAALGASPVVRSASVVCTCVDAARGMPADALAARWRSVLPDVAVSTDPDPVAAVERALASGPAGPVVVAGSLYLVGAVRGHLVDDPALRDPVAAGSR